MLLLKMVSYKKLNMDEHGANNILTEVKDFIDPLETMRAFIYFYFYFLLECFDYWLVGFRKLQVVAYVVRTNVFI